MSTQSLDDVLADVDASELDLTNEVEANEPEVSQEAEGEGDQQEDHNEPDAQGALHAERQRVKRKYTDTVADFERRLSEVNTGFEKKLTESLEANDQKWQQRFNQFAQQFQQPQRKEPEAAQEAPDLFEDQNGFLDHGVKRHIDPIKSEFAQFREHVSRRDAIRDHGQEKVQTAYQALDQAARSGNRDALEAVARVKQSMDPYGDIVEWHAKTSVYSEFGTNPEAAIQKRLEAALEDPAFLAKAAAKLGVKPALVQQPRTNQSLPSLNQVTAAADDEGEEEDATEVFNTALRRGVNR